MPLSFDMPLDQLRAYTGTGAKPAHFERFWDAALAELAATDPDPQWEEVASPASYARCFELWFTGTGGARVHARVTRPKEVANPGPAALEFHGYARKVYDWAQGFKLSLAAAGVTHAGLDCRGQSGLSEDPGGHAGWTLKGHVLRGMTDALEGRPEALFYRHQFLDSVRLLDLVAGLDEVDPGRVATYGRSQGGALALVAAALRPQVARVHATYPFLCDYRRAYQMDCIGAQDPYQDIVTWFRRFDPTHAQEEAFFDVLGLIDVRHLCPRVLAKVQWIIGLADKICPPSTQFAAYNGLAGDKEMVIYPDHGHEDLDHGEDAQFRFLTFQDSAA